MVARECDSRVASEGSNSLELRSEVVELALLLHHGQFLALERLAGTKGISVARLLRQMIRDYLARDSGATEVRPVVDSS
jgi:hypothetical protein